MRQEILLHQAVQTQKTYLEMQCNISRELIRLHKGLLSHYLTKQENRFYSDTCNRLSEHQYKLQQVEEQYLLVQEQFIQNISNFYNLPSKTQELISLQKNKYNRTRKSDRETYAIASKALKLETIQNKQSQNIQRLLPLPLLKKQNEIYLVVTNCHFFCLYSNR